MSRYLAAWVAVLWVMVCLQTQACSLTFQIDGDQDKFVYAELPTFITAKMRPAVQPVADDDRYVLHIRNECAVGETGAAFDTAITVQRNTVYLKSVNGVPLCTETVPPARAGCVKGQYNYVDYKGGAQLSIDEQSILAAAKVLSSIISKEQLAHAAEGNETEQPIHNAVRALAMLLAETTRFDYVLDDLTCSIKSGGAIQYMDYWTLVHNWSSISKRVSDYDPSLIPAGAHHGAGPMFVPITRTMVSFFNQNLQDHPPSPSDTSPDGRNKPVPVRAPTCQLAETLSSPNYLVPPALVRPHVGDVPDLSLTPGIARPELTKEQICAIKWGQDERHVTQAMKREVFKRYGFTGNDDPKCVPVGNRRCEIDHLISRELGGADVIENLWPQAYGTSPWNAIRKDKLENRLHREVCAGHITLDVARQMLIDDWRTAYRKYYGEP